MVLSFSFPLSVVSCLDINLNTLGRLTEELWLSVGWKGAAT